MTLQNSSKINQLLKQWPPGTVAASAWLEKQGVSRQLANSYIKTQWLVTIEHSAYIKAGDSVGWQGGLYSIQHQLKLDIHLGGKTALELQGLGHYIPLGKRQRVVLFGPPGTKLPKWFTQHNWEIELRYVTANLFTKENESEFRNFDLGSFSIKISSPERAILETLYFIPTKQTWDEALYIMEGLATLRPKVLQALLESCQSVKVKRIFLFLATYCNHAWLKELDLNKIELGRGKRVIAKHGFLDKKFKITVPKTFTSLDEGMP